MKIQIATEALRDALRLATKAVKKNSTMPILSGVLFAGKQLACTDLNTRIEVNLPVGLPKPFVVDATRLLGVVESFADEETTLSLTTSRLDVSSGGAKAQLPLMAEVDFPLGHSAGDDLCQFTPDMLHAIVTKVAPFVDQSGSGGFLGGVCFKPVGNELVLLSADHYRVGRLTLGVDMQGKEPFIVPAAALLLAEKTFAGESVHLHATEDWLGFSSDTAHVGTALLAGVYPDVDKFLAMEYDNTMHVEPGLLDAALKLVAPFSERATRVILSLNDDTLNVSVNEQNGKADTSIAVASTGYSTKFALAYGFLNDAVRVFAGMPLDLAFTAGRGAVRFTSPNNESCKHFVMQLELPRE